MNTPAYLSMLMFAGSALAGAEVVEISVSDPGSIMSGPSVTIQFTGAATYDYHAQNKIGGVDFGTLISALKLDWMDAYRFIDKVPTVDEAKQVIVVKYDDGTLRTLTKWSGTENKEFAGFYSRVEAAGRLMPDLKRK